MLKRYDMQEANVDQWGNPKWCRLLTSSISITADSFIVDLKSDPINMSMQPIADLRLRSKQMPPFMLQKLCYKQVFKQ
jgi:hypothetical protein